MKNFTYQAPRPLRDSVSSSSKRGTSQNFRTSNKKTYVKETIKIGKLSFSSQSSYSKDTQLTSEKTLSIDGSLNDLTRWQAPSILSQNSQMYSSKNSIDSKKTQKMAVIEATDRDTSLLGDISSIYEYSSKAQLPNISAKCWTIMDASTGHLLYSSKEHKKREIASLTKMMNLLCICRLLRQYRIDPCETYVEVSKNAAAMKGTSACLKHGDILSIYDLLHGLMLPSGNDAAVALAENFGTYIFTNSEEYKVKIEKDPNGNPPRIHNPARYFVKLMNQVGKELGLNNTSYSNPHGLVDPNNFSTAADQAKLSRHLLKWSLAREIIDKKAYSCEIEQSNKQTRVARWENTNELLGKEGWHGVKTGITTAAGPSLSAYYESRGEAYVIILLCSSSKEIRWVEAPELVEFANKNKERF